MQRNNPFGLGQTNFKQESIPIGCVLPTLPIRGREVSVGDPLTETPWTETPWTETPQTETPWKEHGTRDRGPLEGTWDQAAIHEVTSYRDPPMNRQTGVKTVPCPKLRLPAVTTHVFGISD